MSHANPAAARPSSFARAALAAPLLVLALIAPAKAQDVTALRQEVELLKQQLQRMEERLKGTEQTAASAQTQAANAQAQAAQKAAPASASAFNPAIGVVLDGRFGGFSRNPSGYRIPGFQLGEEASPGQRGFALGETELNFSASVDQWLYANLTVAVESDGTVGVEEAFVQSTALPYGFTAKAGRFFSGIGYLNEQHAHTWDFADQALPYRAFLNNQLSNDGAQLRWLAPTPFFLEFGAEAARGDSFPGGGAAKTAGVYTAFAHVGDDFNESTSWRAGVSHVRSKAEDRVTNDSTNTFRGRSNLTVLDAVLKWAPNGNPADTNVKLQGEYMFRNEQGQFNTLDYDGKAQGWYLQGVYQFAPKWQFALRHDELTANNSGAGVAGTVLETFGDTARRSSAALTFLTSEFGRFRAQYNYDQAGPTTDHQVFLQYTITLGAHGAHAY